MDCETLKMKIIELPDGTFCYECITPWEKFYSDEVFRSPEDAELWLNAGKQELSEGLTNEAT